MSNKPQAQGASARQPETELELLRGEVTSLRRTVGELALLMLEPRIRVQCECGALSCRTVHATSNSLDAGALSVAQKHFPLCEDCKLPAGWTESRRVELAPNYRETVRIANRLSAATRK